MKNRKVFLLLILLSGSLNAFSQDTVAIRPISDLTLDRYLHIPIYIVNKNYVVYEFGKTRKIIYADMPSFKVEKNFLGDGGGFALDKNGIYIQGTLFKIDTTGFKIVGYRNSDEGYYHPFEDLPPKEWLWKNKNTVYKNNTALTGIDAHSFEAVLFVNGPYFKDKNALYYYDKKIEQSNSAAVKSFDIDLYYDKNNIYVAGKTIYTDDGEMLLPVNGALVKTKKYAYQITNWSPLQNVILKTTDEASLKKLSPIYSKVIIKTMDVASLKGLSPSYSMDKYHVYYDTTALPIVPKNFNNIKIWEGNNTYISDGISVYYGTKLQPDLDAKSFGILPNSNFFYDKNGIYQQKYFAEQNKTINEKFPFQYSIPVNQKTVLVIDLAYYIYNHQVYDPWDKKLYTNVSDDQISKLKTGKRFVPYEKEPVSDYGQGFYVLNSKFYFRGTEVKGVDAPSLKYIDYAFRDKNHVYYGLDSGLPDGFFEIIPDADPETFKPFTNGFDKDKSYLYYKMHKLISSKSIELLAIFWKGYLNVGKNDGYREFYRYFFKNEDGYWLVTDEDKPVITFLGKKFDRKWNKAFEDFELPKGL